MKDLEKINPLNALECRRVQHPPAHFSYIELEDAGLELTQIPDWIYLNLKHRFYIDTMLGVDPNGFNFRLKIGFEESKEASFFLLACPLLKRAKN